MAALVPHPQLALNPQGAQAQEYTLVHDPLALWDQVHTLKEVVPTPTTVGQPPPLLSKLKFEVLNAVKEYLGTSLDDAHYKVLKKHDADIIKEFSIPTKIIERLTQQYLPQQSIEKSTEDIWKIKMEHASKQQVPLARIHISTAKAKEKIIQKLNYVKKAYG
ncbi:hypothetical protein Tco_1004290 [Tanacetum coccineum]|uniref:Uncharacterized protein n=1 Tax=Tanacetum coccineum TaxID=301880 RepID=A0ABQ5FDT4_9ASTR